MTPDISQRFVIINLINCPHTSCQNPKDAPSKAESDDRLSKCGYNILEHESAVTLPCVKPVAKASTTYRDHYCRRKGVPKAEKICLPFPAIHVSGDKIKTVSTYKEDYHPYSAKDQQANRGEAVQQRHNLCCSKKTFEGKSETRNAFKLSGVCRKPPVAAPFKEVNRLGKDPTFSDKTTYASEFKNPKKYEKTVSYAPKHNITVSREPFKYVSHYMKEFRYPKTKIDTSDRPRRKSSYDAPSVPMDSMTTYKASFAFRGPASRPTQRRVPDQRCAECKRSRSKVRQTHCGDGDKDGNAPTHVGDCPATNNSSFRVG